MPKVPIYLDYSATTPIDPRVAEKMIPFLTEQFGNPASRSHAFGWDADKAVELAREEVAGLVLKRPVKSGVPVPATAAAARLAVRRGETVRVDVASGWARLHFEAVAETDAREGDQIALRNPISGKTFRARVGAAGRATVVIGGPAI